MKDLIILAKGGTRTECPFDGAEVWGVNDVASFPEFKDKQIDRAFTFDPRSKEFLEEVRKKSKIWSWRDYADVKYPLEEVIKRFGVQYFTNTLSYMIALGIYEKFERIRMYGVDAPYGGIYFMEKAGLEYWIGRGQEAGIEFITAQGSNLLRTHDGLLYGQRGATSIDLYLSERMHLINLLPKEGDYDAVYRSNLCRWLLALKVKEKDDFKVQIGANPNGQIAYSAPAEFISTIHFPIWMLEYVKEVLINLEKQKKLPVHAISVYERFAKFKQPESIDDYKKDIRVSYVMATKNRAPHLAKALENAKMLLQPEDELIVVDGNSTDNTKEVLEIYKPIISKLIVGDDINAAHALNKGYMEAKGKYVKQLPDDDVIFANEMERSIKYMDDHPDIDLLVCGGIKHSGGKQILISAPEDYGRRVDDVLTFGACGAGFVHKRESFARFGLLNTEYTDIDQEIACRIIALGGVVRFLSGRHYYHTVYNHSTSVQNIAKWDADYKKLQEKYKADECLV